MFQNMTAFLEAIDERVEQHAQQQVAMVAEKEEEEEKRRYERRHNHSRAGEMSHAGFQDEASDHVSQTGASHMLLPQFPAQPPLQRSPHAGRRLNNDRGEPSLKMGRDVDLSLLKRKEEDIDTLKQDVRRHQAVAEVARQELLQRSLQVHQLEEGLRDTKARLDEHKAKSRCLLEEKQRECDALRRRLGLHDGGNSHVDGKEDMNNKESAVTRQQLDELEGVVASMKRTQEQLQAQIAASRREVSAAHEQRLAVTQQLEFVRLDLRGAQEALDNEVEVHQQSKALLRQRQQELNELRAAVEKNGGTFTAAGSLIALRGNDIGMRDQMQMSRQLLEKQNALETALRDAAEWRRRCERATHKLEEERTTRVNVTPSPLHAAHDAGESRSVFPRRTPSAGGAVSLATELIAAVDAATLRFGRLLRRQPVLRIAAAMYILCLHGWFVMVWFMVPRAADPITGVCNNSRPVT